MYKSLLDGKSIWIPSYSNCILYDYFENDVPISVKSLDLVINMVLFKNMIPTDSDLGLLMNAFANHDKKVIFDLIAKVCPVSSKIMSSLGGTSENHFREFVKNNTFDDFVNIVKSVEGTKNKQGGCYGIPKNYKTGNELWNQGSTNLIHFCCLTILCKFMNQSEELTRMMKRIGSSCVFRKIKIKNGLSHIQSSDMGNFKRYGLKYWGNCSTPFNNYPAIQAIEEFYDNDL